MITEKDLQEAIAECQGQKNPNANTCIKLASYYTILNNLRGNNFEMPSYSFAPAPDSGKITYIGNTEFANKVNGADVQYIMETMDELMSTLEVINPRLYNSVMRRL